MSFWDGSRWVQDAPAAPPPRRRTVRHVFGAVAEAGLITALTFGLIAGSAFAAKGGSSSTHGGKTSTSTMSLVLLDSTDGVAHHGQRVTFDVSTTATDLPTVGLRCYQDSSWVYDAYVGYYPGYLFDQWFTLDSGYWADGVDATCTARLFSYDNRGRERVLATMTFPVAP